MKNCMVLSLWKPALFCAMAFFSLMAAFTYKDHVGKKSAALRFYQEKIYTFLYQQKIELMKKVHFLEQDYPLYKTYQERGFFKKRSDKAYINLFQLIAQKTGTQLEVGALSSQEEAPTFHIKLYDLSPHHLQKFLKELSHHLLIDFVPAESSSTSGWIEGNLVVKLYT